MLAYCEAAQMHKGSLSALALHGILTRPYKRVWVYGDLRDSSRRILNSRDLSIVPYKYSYSLPKKSCAPISRSRRFVSCFPICVR